MKKNQIIPITENSIQFIAFEPNLRQLPASQGGGFRLTLDVAEDEFFQMQRLLEPSLKNTTLHITITPDTSE